MVGPEGLEPPTTCFEGRYSIQLSYGPEMEFITRSGWLVTGAFAALVYATVERNPMRQLVTPSGFL